MVWQVMFIDLEFHQSREWCYILNYLSLMSIPILLLQIKNNPCFKYRGIFYSLFLIIFSQRSTNRAKRSSVDFSLL